jgi:hypothetical protein
MRTSGPRNYLNERRVRHINNNTACTAPAVRSRWGNPSNRKVADIYISTPALRHWEAPRRTTVDARNQPADKRMINRRLKPHRRPCAHFWSGSKPYGSPPGREEFVAPAVDNGHKRRFHHVSNSDKVFGTHKRLVRNRTRKPRRRGRRSLRPLPTTSNGQESRRRALRT